MTIQNANPSSNPANNGSLAGLFREILNKVLQDVAVMLPAKVVSFDRTVSPPRVTVQPQIDVLTTSNETVPRAQIASVPVVQYGGGGFFLSFNLNPGDTGWIKAADRDMTTFLESLAESRPKTLRIHDFSDSVFYPDVMGGYTIDSEDQENAVLQNLDGTVKIALSENKIKMVAPDIELVSNVKITGDLEVTGDSKIDGREIVEGDIASGGNITAVGEITPHTPIPP